MYSASQSLKPSYGHAAMFDVGSNSSDSRYENKSFRPQCSNKYNKLL